MRAFLASHDAVLRTAIESHGGYVFATGGDGFAVAFARTGGAIECAISSQRALHEAKLPAVRMALHTGEAVERDGDYFGPAVNRAARLMAVGHGGQVLVSQATAEIARDADMRDLGEHRLRDLSRPEHVFQLVVPGLRVEFPRLRSLDTLPTNLPLQLTSFVGRAGEIKQLCELVEGQRLVTITGVGGVGKTRLALQVAAEVATTFRDGVWLCELAAAGDGEALADVVALALGVSARPGVTLAESIVEFLRPKELLLVIDNCEHLLDAIATLVGAVLRDCLRVRVLATSREGLGINGEQLWPLRSLPMPTLDGSPEEIADTDAVRLFVERAHSVDPSFVLDRVSVSVAEICRRLDGLPLAIELAAARTGTLAVSEIAELLDERFRLLTGSRRGGVERHQTLRAAVDWSYSLLGETERTVFDRLGVFAGSFDTSAAQHVACGEDIDRFEVFDALAELVAKSMLSVERAEDDRTRFQLLETLRQYAMEQLGERGEVDQLRRRHAAYFAALAPTLGAQLRSTDEAAARTRVVTDFDNLRIAIGWALDSNDRRDQLLAVEIVGPLASLASTMRSAGFGAWVERTVPAARAASPDLRFAVIGGAAFAATIRGDFATAKLLADEAFVAGVPAECPDRAGAYTAVAVTLAATDLVAASTFMRESAESLARLGDDYTTVTVRSIAGIFAALGVDSAQGHIDTEIALRDARRLGNPTALSVALYAYALARWTDESDDAFAAIEESLAWTDRGGSDVVYAEALELLARLQRDRGDTAGALTTAAASLRRSIIDGNRQSVLSSQWYLAEALGLLAQDEPFAAVLHGYSTRGPLADTMPAVAGPEADIHERAVAAIRGALGDERFEELAECGAGMSYEESIDFTMSELARVLAEAEDQ